MQVISIFAVVSLSFLITWACRVVHWVWVKPKRIERSLREQGLLGTSYKLLHGDTRRMASMIQEAKAKTVRFGDDIVPRVHPFHHHVVEKYGKCSFFWIGPIPRVIIMEPEKIKEILNNNHVFKKPLPNPLTKFLIAGLPSYEDDKWIKHRRILNPAFHMEKLKNMLPAMTLSCNNLIKEWEMLISERNNPIELDVQPFFEDLTADIISRTAFGSNFMEGRKIFELQREQAEHTIQVLQSVYIPGSRFFPTKRNRRMKQIDDELKEIILNIIIKKREKSVTGESSSEDDDDDDLLSILMKSNEDEIHQEGKSFGMSIQEVVEECKQFYFAGQESSADLLTWTVLMLAMNPKWQAFAREEVSHSFENGFPDMDGLNRLKIVTMIIYEVLRLYPPATIFNRTLHQETKLGELTLPPGVLLVLPILFVHHDHELWGEDSKEFKPERFSRGVANATQNRLTFFPFSSGPRICIGINFALMEIKLALALILRRFSFEVSPSYTHAPSYVVTLRPQHGVHVLVKKI